LYFSLIAAYLAYETDDDDDDDNGLKTETHRQPAIGQMRQLLTRGEHSMYNAFIIGLTEGRMDETAQTSKFSIVTNS